MPEPVAFGVEVATARVGRGPPAPHPSSTDSLDRRRPERGLAPSTPERLLELGAARRVDERRVGLDVGDEALTPPHQRHQHRRQREAGLGEPVLVPARVLLIRHLHHHVVLDEPAETIGEHRPRDPEVVDELVESAKAAERSSDDEDRPSIADHAQRVFDRGVRIELLRDHNGQRSV